MAGLLVIVLVSWLLVRRKNENPLAVLGLRPSRERFKEFLLGAVYMAALAGLNFTWQARLKQVSYEVNPDYEILDFFGGSYWIVRAVLLEEFVFRGVLLYLLITRIGTVRACLVSSAVFGMYHWFSYEVFGSRVVLMVYVFLVTGCGGWMFAFAFAKTRSLYAPVGLHLGWNLVSAIVFSTGPLGEQWLVQRGTEIPWNDWATLLFFTLQAVLAPGIATWYLQTRYGDGEAS
jgi:membrane protease YdiL (CAAX protease family)